MAEELTGKRILLVEDEYMLAADLMRFLSALGVSVVGPAGTLPSALALVQPGRLDAAILDINLHKERSYPVADALLALDVPIVFTTGYDELLMARAYVGLPRCQKPIDKEALAKMLVRILSPQP